MSLYVFISISCFVLCIFHEKTIYFTIHLYTQLCVSVFRMRCGGGWEIIISSHLCFLWKPVTYKIMLLQHDNRKIELELSQKLLDKKRSNTRTIEVSKTHVVLYWININWLKKSKNVKCIKTILWYLRITFSPIYDFMGLYTNAYVAWSVFSRICSNERKIISDLYCFSLTFTTFLDYASWDEQKLIFEIILRQGRAMHWMPVCIATMKNIILFVWELPSGL